LTQVKISRKDRGYSMRFYIPVGIRELVLRKFGNADIFCETRVLDTGKIVLTISDKPIGRRIYRDTRCKEPRLELSIDSDAVRQAVIIPDVAEISNIRSDNGLLLLDMSQVIKPVI